MNTEYEIKVLDITIEQMTARLEELGYKKAQTLNFKRKIYELNDAGSWARLRTDGSKTTLTLKEYVSDAIDGVKELEVEVSDFDQTALILEKIGHSFKSYQENRRTVFIGPNQDIEVVIDEWPLIPPYLEIEAKDEASVQQLLAQINTSGLATTSAPTSEVYSRYNLNLDEHKILTF